MKHLPKKARTRNDIFYAEDYGFLGHLIYSERKIRGISKEKVALDLNLSSYIIENLETGHLNRTPGLSYMIGFLRTYADYLGLNPQEIIQYIKPLESSVFEEETVLNVPLQQRQLPSHRIIWGSVLALILILVGYSSLHSDDLQPSPLQAIKINTPAINQSSAEEDLTASLQQFLNIYHKPFLHTAPATKTF